MRILNDEDVLNIDIPCETCDVVPDWITPATRCLECIGYQHRKAQHQQDLKDFIEWLEKQKIDYEKSTDRYYYCINGSGLELLRCLVEENDV